MYALAKRLLFTLDPEVAHNLVKGLSGIAPNRLLKRFCQSNDAALKTTLAGATLANPIGLAAGFDKNAELLPLLQALDFGFLELGSVTALPSLGNPRPRIFRLPADESLINRMGLPNWGVEAFVKNLAKQKINVPMGINIAKTPGATDGIADMSQTFAKLQNLGTYTVLNLSCPNTSDGKTFEDPEQFTKLAKSIAEVREANKKRPPLLIKLSPDTDAKTTRKLVEIALKFDFDGFVVSNTSISRTGLKTAAHKIEKIGRGGLSGRALQTSADAQLKVVSAAAGKEAILIGVGGIMDLRGVLAKLAAGAQLVQVYTGFIYGGPFFVRDLNRGLARLCKKHGLKSYRELIGNGEAARLS